MAGRRDVCGESWGNRRESRSPSVEHQSWALGHLVETAKYVEPDVEHGKCLALLTFWALGRHCSMEYACIYLHREKRKGESLMGTRSYGAFLKWDIESHLWRSRRAMWRSLLEKWDYPQKQGCGTQPMRRLESSAEIHRCCVPTRASTKATCVREGHLLVSQLLIPDIITQKLYYLNHCLAH